MVGIDWPKISIGIGAGAWWWLRRRRRRRTTGGREATLRSTEGVQGARPPAWASTRPRDDDIFHLELARGFDGMELNRMQTE
ncbi:Os12g0123150 [Oryza sativa Japonica Group]|uniref:Os12g0123150 protein n=1 Tax=Oryza sativa subsp. japonica TaxID=39947 RepID=A0A0P0Y6N6_ORYSJ|nr:Os12g0123150 [Oryza sativa Japonica Group]